MKHAFCDRCGRYCIVRNHRDCMCHECELGMNSIAAMLNPRWARPMTSSEIQLAHTWLMIELGSKVSCLMTRTPESKTEPHSPGRPRCEKCHTKFRRGE